MKHTPGTSFKENGALHLGRKLVLGPREMDFRLGEENLWASTGAKSRSDLRCGKR